MAQSYIDIVRSRWNAQRAESCAERLASGASVEAFIEHGQRRIERLWQIVMEVEPGPDEDPQQLATDLKLLPREDFLPEFFDYEFPQLDLVAKQIGVGASINAQKAQMRAASNRIMMDWDSRVDARVYVHEKSRTKTQKQYARWRSTLRTLEEEHPNMTEMDYAKEIYRREKEQFGISRSVDTIRRKMRPGRK